MDEKQAKGCLPEEPTLSCVCSPLARMSRETYSEELDGSGVERRVKRKETIREDLDRLDDYFRDLLTEGGAVKLAQYCWLHFSLHFALCSSEAQVQLEKSDIRFEKDGEGKEFIVLYSDFILKNCGGGPDCRFFEASGRTYHKKVLQCA